MKICRPKLRMLPVILIFTLLFVPLTLAKDLSTTVPEIVGLSSERLTRIDAHLKTAVEQQRVKGIVAMVARNGKIAYNKAFGDMDDGKPMQKNAIFGEFWVFKG